MVSTGLDEGGVEGRKWRKVNPTGSTEEGMVGPVVCTYLRVLISRMTEVLALKGCSVDDGASHIHPGVTLICGSCIIQDRMHPLW